MVHISFLKELMSAKIAKKNYKQRYQHIKESVAPTVATPVTTGDVAITNLTHDITTATGTTVLKELRTTPALKPKVYLLVSLVTCWSC